jgi:hypothetical protein
MVLGFYGKEWYIKNSQSEGCSLSRSTSFNKSNVNMFLENMEEVYTVFPEFTNGNRPV